MPGELWEPRAPAPEPSHGTRSQRFGDDLHERLRAASRGGWQQIILGLIDTFYFLQSLFSVQLDTKTELLMCLINTLSKGIIIVCMKTII